VRIDLVVFGFAAMDGFHIEGTTQDEGDVLVRTGVGEPVPGENTLDGHDQAMPIRGHGFEEGFRRGFHLAVQQEFPVAAQNTDIHASGIQVDAAVKWVLIGVESHEVSSFLSNLALFPPQHTTAVR
jgi:hypothetical protein